LIFSNNARKNHHQRRHVTWTQQRVEKLWDKLEKLGIRPERLQLEWISAAPLDNFIMRI
jgi:coenzyme F420-reducing hydrogenase delta subunit